MMVMRRLLLVTAAAGACAVGSSVIGYAHPGWSAGAQPRAFDLAADRNTQGDDSAEQPSSKSSSRAVPADDQDSRPRGSRDIYDRTYRDRTDRDDRTGSTSRERDERARGRNYRD
jgi:hypothetical protein